MTLILILTGAIAWIYYTVHENRRRKRIILFNDLGSIYDRMELYVIQNNITPNNNIIEYLRTFKNLVINKGFADVRIYLAIELTTPEDVKQMARDRYLAIKEDVPAELLLMSDEFHRTYDQLVVQSMWSLSFLCFFAKIFILKHFSDFRSKSLIRTNNLFGSVRSLFSHENVIAYDFSRQKLASA